MNVLIDSSGWIEYFSNGVRAKRFSDFITKTKKNQLILPTIVLYEVYRKVKREVGENNANQAIAYMVDSSTIVSLDEKVAIHAADISIEKKLAMADAIIYATSQIYKSKLITMDSHFKGLENVKLV